MVQGIIQKTTKFLTLIGGVMKRKYQLIPLLTAVILIGLTSSVNADNILFPNNNGPLVNETETTGAFGANQAFTLEEDDISETMIDDELTNEVINEIEKKIETK